MTISQRSIKILWGNAGGRCSFSDCGLRLCDQQAKEGVSYTIGEMAHICGDKPGANRHDPNQTEAERDDYKNLILLCPTHHALIDRKENEAIYSVKILQDMKAAHEGRLLDVLDKKYFNNKTELAQHILPLLEENRQVWLHYGPLSELARTQPHNNAAHAVWATERLSVIVPNNRRITALLNQYKSLFDMNEQGTVAAFLVHSRSYEQWVNDLIPYAAVKGFPVEFDELIRKASNGGI